MGDYGYCMSSSDQTIPVVDLGQIASTQSLFSPQNLTAGVAKLDDTFVMNGDRKLDGQLLDMTGKTETVDANLSSAALENGSGDSSLVKSQIHLNGLEPALAVSANGDQLTDSSVNDVITSLNQLVLSTEQFIATSSAPSVWSTAGSDDILNFSQTVSGSLDVQNTTSSSCLVLPNIPQPSNSVNYSMQSQRRAIIGHQSNAPASTGNNSQPNLVFGNNAKYPNWSNGSQQMPQHVRWANGGQAYGQNGHLNNNYPTLPQHKRSLPGLNPMQLAAQISKGYNVPNGVPGINHPLLLPAANAHLAKVARNNMLPAQYTQAAINSKGMGMDEQYNASLLLQVCSVCILLTSS